MGSVCPPNPFYVCSVSSLVIFLCMCPILKVLILLFFVWPQKELRRVKNKNEIRVIFAILLQGLFYL